MIITDLYVGLAYVSPDEIERFIRLEYEHKRLQDQ
jgi:hypothetical protein